MLDMMESEKYMGGGGEGNKEQKLPKWRFSSSKTIRLFTGILR